MRMAHLWKGKTISMAASAPPILSLSSIFNPNQISSNSSSILCYSQLPLKQPNHSSKTQFCGPALPFKSAQKWRNYASIRNLLLLEADPVDNSQLVDSTTADDGEFSVISVLLFVAFIGLSILTIGVIYIAVTDFLQKRERDKFEKEESAKKKNSKKGKVRARSRSGPRGFGQKIDEDDEL